MRWIPFSEREPTDEEMLHGIWCATHDDRRLDPWKIGDRTFYDALRAQWTHFCPVPKPTPPADLPPKPLPELSEGSRWGTDSSYPAIYRDGYRFCLVENGTAIYASPVEYMSKPTALPLADIEALKAVGK